MTNNTLTPEWGDFDSELTVDNDKTKQSYKRVRMETEVPHRQLEGKPPVRVSRKPRSRIRHAESSQNIESIALLQGAVRLINCMATACLATTLISAFTCVSFVRRSASLPTQEMHPQTEAVTKNLGLGFSPWFESDDMSDNLFESDDMSDTLVANPDVAVINAGSLVHKNLRERSPATEPRPSETPALVGQMKTDHAVSRFGLFRKDEQKESTETDPARLDLADVGLDSGGSGRDSALGSGDSADIGPDGGGTGRDPVLRKGDSAGVRIGTDAGGWENEEDMPWHIRKIVGLERRVTSLESELKIQQSVREELERLKALVWQLCYQRVSVGEGTISGDDGSDWYQNRTDH